MTFHRVSTLFIRLVIVMGCNNIYRPCSCSPPLLERADFPKPRFRKAAEGGSPRQAPVRDSSTAAKHSAVPLAREWGSGSNAALSTHSPPTQCHQSSLLKTSH